MALVSNPDLLVLHGLRLKSFAPVEVVAEITELPVETVTSWLDTFRDKEWARYREGVLTGWMLTAVGRGVGERLLAEELDGLGARAEILALYRRFLGLNQALLQVCTDWQLRPLEGVDELVMNDHTDPGYDVDVVKALRALDADVQPVCAHLAAMLGRFSGYADRLTAALEKIEAGGPEWFTKPTIDSYHTVWFELHENLLATLGIERGKEDT